jgi:hypothetical protein
MLSIHETKFGHIPYYVSFLGVFKKGVKHNIRSTMVLMYTDNHWKFERKRENDFKIS